MVLRSKVKVTELFKVAKFQLFALLSAFIASRRLRLDTITNLIGMYIKYVLLCQGAKGQGDRCIGINKFILFTMTTAPRDLKLHLMMYLEVFFFKFNFHNSKVKGQCYKLMERVQLIVIPIVNYCT